MAFGQNAPSGLVPVKSITSVENGGQNEPINIKPGYAFNIFRGDLVYQGTDGYLHNIAELGGYATAQSVGVFNGCSYIQPTAANPADPASPARPFWPAGTQTLNDSPVTGYVMIDPLTVYSIQSDENGIAFEDVGKTASISFIPGPPTPVGNTLTGNSYFVLNGSTTAANLQDANCRIIGFDKTLGNPIPFPGAGKVPYVNVLVLIQNHSFMQRAPGAQ